MSPFPWYDLAILAGLILINGVFSMSELAIVSARTAKLRMAADKGSRGAKTSPARSRARRWGGRWPTGSPRSGWRPIPPTTSD